jgi:hypothetical protein
LRYSSAIKRGSFVADRPTCGEADHPFGFYPGPVEDVYLHAVPFGYLARLFGQVLRGRLVGGLVSEVPGEEGGRRELAPGLCASGDVVLVVVDQGEGSELAALRIGRGPLSLVAVEAVQTQRGALGRCFGGGEAGRRAFGDGQGEGRVVEFQGPGALRGSCGDPPECIQAEGGAVAEADEK